MKFATLEEKSTYWSNAENALTSKTRSLSLEYKGKKNGFSFYKVSTYAPDIFLYVSRSPLMQLFIGKTLIRTE